MSASPFKRRIRLRIDPELHFFLPREARQERISRPLQCRRSVKDFLESIGIPHVEIGAIRVNGQWVPFEHLLEGGEEVEVQALRPPVDPTVADVLRPQPLAQLRFLCDVHLGRLTRFLRLLGFDTAYRNHMDDEALVEIAAVEGRVLLTRDRLLLKRSRLQFGYCLRETQPRAQLREVVRRYGLQTRLRPFSRCLPCNGRLQAVEKSEIRARLPNNTARYFDEFYRCETCGRIYWAGSHYERLEQIVHEVTEWAQK